MAPGVADLCTLPAERGACPNMISIATVAARAIGLLVGSLSVVLTEVWALVPWVVVLVLSFINSGTLIRSPEYFLISGDLG